MTGRYNHVNHDAGVSESIGFILLFAIIIAGIGLVTLYGYPMLLQQQVSANEQIMEKNMIVLQNDVKSLAYKTVPYTETSLKVDGGALTVYNMSYSATSANFSIYGTSTNTLTCIKNDAGLCATAGSPLIFSPGDLRYESTGAQTGISLENGAVVKRMLAESGSAMLAEPRWFYDGTTKTAVIYLIGFNTTNIMSRAGVGTVKMSLGSTNYTAYSIDPISDKISIKYTPNPNADYSTAWGNYFTGTLGMKGSGGTYYFDPTPSTLVIKKNEIIVISV